MEEVVWRLTCQTRNCCRSEIDQEQREREREFERTNRERERERERVGACWIRKMVNMSFWGFFKENGLRYDYNFFGDNFFRTE